MSSVPNTVAGKAVLEWIQEGTEEKNWSVSGSKAANADKISKDFAVKQRREMGGQVAVNKQNTS